MLIYASSNGGFIMDEATFYAKEMIENQVNQKNLLFLTHQMLLTHKMFTLIIEQK